MVMNEGMEKAIDDIHASIDEITMRALEKIDPILSDKIKNLSPKDIEFGENIKLRKHLFSGKLSLGSIQQYKYSSHYNSSSNTIEDTSGWRSIQYFTDKKFTNYTGWLVCNADYDYISVFKNDISDFYRIYSMEINDGGGSFSPNSIFASNNPKKMILTVADKKLAAMNLAYSFGEKLVFASTITYVGQFRCGAVSLDSYTCVETDEYVELPICPIYAVLNDETKVCIGSYLTTDKKIHVQFYEKEKEISKARVEVRKELRKQKRKRYLQLGLKIVGGVILAATAITMAVILLP